MKAWLLCLCGVCAAVALRAEGALRASKPDVKKEIVAVVEAQLAAFRKGDATKAYTYSATALQRQKPLRMFAAIVKDSYPEIWSNTGAEFGLVRDDGSRGKLLVHIKGKEGEATYEYYVLKERVGWRIEGVLRHEPSKNEKV